MPTTPKNEAEKGKSQMLQPLFSKVRAHTRRLGLVIACLGFVQACAPITLSLIHI